MSQLKHKIGFLICRIFMRILWQLLMRLLFRCAGVAAHANEAIVGLVDARLNRSWVSAAACLQIQISRFQSNPQFFNVPFHNKSISPPSAGTTPSTPTATPPTPPHHPDRCSPPGICLQVFKRSLRIRRFGWIRLVLDTPSEPIIRVTTILKKTPNKCGNNVGSRREKPSKQTSLSCL